MPIFLLASLLDIQPEMQKVIIMDRAENDKTLADCGITTGSEVMIVGSLVKDVIDVAKVPSVSLDLDAV